MPNYHLKIRPFICSSTWRAIWSFCPSVCPSVYLCVCSFICPFVNLSVCSSVHPYFLSFFQSIYLWVRLSICLSVRLRCRCCLCGGPHDLDDLEDGRSADDKDEESEHPRAHGSLVVLVLQCGRNIAALVHLLLGALIGDTHPLLGDHDELFTLCLRWSNPKKSLLLLDEVWEVSNKLLQVQSGKCFTDSVLFSRSYHCLSLVYEVISRVSAQFLC